MFFNVDEIMESILVIILGFIDVMIEVMECEEVKMVELWRKEDEKYEWKFVVEWEKDLKEGLKVVDIKYKVLEYLFS